jgi:hypothetical protein
MTTINSNGADSLLLVPIQPVHERSWNLPSPDFAVCSSEIRQTGKFEPTQITFERFGAPLNFLFEFVSGVLRHSRLGLWVWCCRSTRTGRVWAPKVREETVRVYCRRQLMEFRSRVGRKSRRVSSPGLFRSPSNWRTSLGDRVLFVGGAGERAIGKAVENWSESGFRARRGVRWDCAD